MAKKQGGNKARKKQDLGPPVSFPKFSLPGWGQWMALAGILLVVMGFVYQGAMTGGMVFLSSDAGNAQSFAAVGDAGLAAGQYPLWNPYIFAGMHSFG